MKSHSLICDKEMRRGALLWIPLLILSACETTDYDGYTRIKDSVHYKLLAVGDESKPVTKDSYVSADFELRDLQKQLIVKKHLNRVLFEHTELPPQVKSQMGQSVEGDSISMIGRSDQLGLVNWFSPIEFDSDSARYEILFNVKEVLLEPELRQIRAEERLMKDYEMKGLIDLKSARDSLGFVEGDRWEGIYMRIIRSGTGARPTSGKMALLQYRTFLADGKKIDDTYAGEPFEYHIGKPDQVLPGFGKAVARLKVGGKALVLIPAELAFGMKGSSSGIVPPGSPLIYEVELIEVR